ncbi:MAG: hypothetical protein L0214_00225 [candidate division NC10 bacterium]|nr:hypothetical protein [candidate division NC10 bacterium]
MPTDSPSDTRSSPGRRVRVRLTPGGFPGYNPLLPLPARDFPAQDQDRPKPAEHYRELLRLEAEALRAGARAFQEEVARYAGGRAPAPVVRAAQVIESGSSRLARLLEGLKGQDVRLDSLANCARTSVDCWMCLAVGRLVVCVACASDPEVRHLAAFVLIVLALPFVGDPAARRALPVRAREWGLRPAALLAFLLLPWGLILAGADAERPRPIRLGRRWVGGKAAETSPLDLPFGEFVAWLLQEARNNAEAMLADPRPPGPAQDSLDLEGEPENPFPDQDGDPGSARERSPHPGRSRGRPDQEGPLAALIAAETARELLDALSPQERQVLRLVDQGTPPTEAAAAVAPSPGAARVLLHRLRKKAIRLLPHGLRKKTRRPLKNPPARL